MSATANQDRLVQALRPVVAAAGLDLEAVDVTPAGRRRLVRVVVDKDGGVTLDEIADTTHRVSRQLDDDDLMGDTTYTLEVTSPGTDRPLTQPRHWRRNVGRLVAVTTSDGGFTGRLRDAGDDAAALDVGGGRRVVRYADVTKARVEVEFNRKDG
ncbi:MAG: ribosome maturation factor RimP [Actinomycetota bacterium]|nr:ribosome maturation factor RimP [Actinomycetota bacterium]